MVNINVNSFLIQIVTLRVFWFVINLSKCLIRILNWIDLALKLDNEPSYVFTGLVEPDHSSKRGLDRGLYRI